MKLIKSASVPPVAALPSVFGVYDPDSAPKVISSVGYTACINSIQNCGDVLVKNSKSVCSLVKMTIKNIHRPGQDVAIKIGVCEDITPMKRKREIWFWRGQCWLKAASNVDFEWYNNKSYILCPVDVENLEDVLTSLKMVEI